MATKLYLRDTKDNAIGIYRDMITTAGAGVAPLGEISTAASGTQIQWKDNGQTELLEWISGRVPSGGFTLAGTMNFSIWARESNMNANCGARSRVFKRTAAGSETEVAGGPYNDGVEFSTGPGEFTWSGTPTSTAFAENDRIIVRYYITNVGTMASGHTCSLDFGAADGSQGDSFFEITENVSFKAEGGTIHEGAGAVAAGGTLAGAAVLDIHGQGAVAASTNLAGAPSLTIEAAGAPAAGVTLAGAGVLTVEAAGAVTTSALLAGASVLDIGAQGNIGAAVNVAGAAVLDIEAAGALNASASMEGAPVLTIAAAGAPLAAVTVDGDLTLLVGGVTHEGAGAIEASVSVAGAGSLLAEGAGAVSSSVSLAGAAGLVMEGAEALTASVLMAGLAQMDLAVAGVLSAGVDLAGAPGLDIEAAGAAQASVVVAGDGEIGAGTIHEGAGSMVCSVYLGHGEVVIIEKPVPMQPDDRVVYHGGAY